MEKISFPLKRMIELLKICDKYMDIMYLDTEGNIRGRKEDEDSLGEYFIVPDLYDDLNQMRELTPLAFKTKDFLDGIKNLKAKTLKCWKWDSHLYVTDERDEGTPAMAEIPSRPYNYSEFVENVWKRAFDFNYRELSEDEILDLNDYKAIVCDAYYNDDVSDPIQIIVSGKDFELKKLLGISVAAVDKFHEYQEHCTHNHVILKIQYKVCDVFMLCGVV